MAGENAGTIALESNAKARVYQAGLNGVATGDVVSLSGGKVLKLYADTTNNTVVGIALNAAIEDGYVSVMYSGSFDPDFAAPNVIGAMYYLASATGDFTIDPTDIAGGDYVHHIAYATSASSMTLAVRALGVTR